MIPAWWGVQIAAAGSGGAVEITEVRRARPNRHIDELMLGGLLWKTETKQLMRERGVPTKLCNGSIRQLHKRMLADVPFYVIRQRVCRQLRKRQGGLRGIMPFAEAQLQPKQMGLSI